MSAEILLNLVNKVKKIGPNAWIALCPAHNDNRPSLSIKENPDGRVLIKCWAGCGALAVIQSVGLNWIDLAPDHYQEDYERSKLKFRGSMPIPWRELTQYLREDLEAVQIGAENLALGAEDFSLDDLRRLFLVSVRIKKILDRVNA